MGWGGVGGYGGMKTRIGILLDGNKFAWGGGVRWGYENKNWHTIGWEQICMGWGGGGAENNNWYLVRAEGVRCGEGEILMVCLVLAYGCTTSTKCPAKNQTCK